jgi:hypothetical protein
LDGADNWQSRAVRRFVTFVDDVLLRHRYWTNQGEQYLSELFNNEPAPGGPMRLSRRGTALMVAAGVGIGGVGAALAAVAPVKPTELNVERAAFTDAANWRGGEPEIAVNPRNSQNMVMVWAAMKQLTDPKTGVTYPGALAQFVSPPTGMSTIQCQMAYTFNGGKSWIAAVFPLREKPSCGDPMVVADSTGAFEIAYDLMGNVYTPSTEGTQPIDQVVVSRSADGGRHWSVPVDVGTIVDRPFFRIDPSTDWLYEVSGGAITLSTPRQLVISRDHGKTWTPKRDFPSNHLAVNHGVIATTLQSSGMPAKFTFAVSNDSGKSYKQATIPTASTGGSGDWVSADPTHAGRFAAMQQVGDVLEVLVTSDNGKTWGQPLHLSISGRGVALPWFDYGPRGDLGVMWKSTDSAGNFLVYTALMRAGSKAFSRPVKISTKPSAGADFINEGAGDDLSWITVDRSNAYIGWGDRRSGILNAWFATMPLAAY